MDVCSPIFKLPDPFSTFAITHCFSTVNFRYVAMNVCSRHVSRSQKKRITDRISHLAGDPITLNILKTHGEAYTTATELEGVDGLMERLIPAGI
ncbi:hypothetical protein TNCV_329061 [Trichonephila clavipes]|nr:hypothetical protein TNCV_3833991 [Trichonephila clavipes]GFV16987.1 hypothetical protein TNCV_329061 [Trichonephila clavipes]